VLLHRVERAPALDDALRMALPHRVHVVVAHRLRADGALEIERDEARLDASVGELADYLLLGLAYPVALPVLRERFDVRTLARDPFLRAGIAVQINNAHRAPPSRIAPSWTPCRMWTPGNPRARACAPAAGTWRSPCLSGSRPARQIRAARRA